MNNLNDENNDESPAIFLLYFILSIPISAIVFSLLIILAAKISLYLNL